MKKRLNFLCVLMLVLLIAEIVLVPVIGYVWGFGDSGNSAFARGTFHPSYALLLCFFVFFICMIYCGISSLIDFVKFILNVNRDKVFVRENVTLLRKCAWKIIGLILSAVIILIIIKDEPADIFEIASSGVECIFYFIVAEVFEIGIKLREEQELTI
ncbi:MAG: DUF2975 domain-containing protein [Bacteroidaceae bacterium]|nr:DUF2975 domain-containing protein [Bacteroidaceae bacterium]